MSAPIKFDFSSYPAAISAIPAIREQKHPAESQESQESHGTEPKNLDSLPNAGQSSNRRIAGIVEVYGDFHDDRHHCRDCRHLSSTGYCIQQRFRPVDDIPRRCEDFTGYPDLLPIGDLEPKGYRSMPPADPLIVTVYTPSGTPMTIRADNAGHAEWLRKMNPKPESPAPKPDPAPRGQTISEAEHNAAGRFFKFLATWPDGRQCYLCQMPRQTIDEMRAQYPTAIHIEPIENEDYPND
jgi:hypothetical protein